MKVSETRNGVVEAGSPRVDQPIAIVLEGALDCESVWHLDSQFSSAAFATDQGVTLDMSGLRLVDEAAISSILRGMDKLQDAGTDLEVRYPSPMALQLFEMCIPLQIVGIEFACEAQEFSD